MNFISATGKFLVPTTLAIVSRTLVLELFLNPCKNFIRYNIFVMDTVCADTSCVITFVEKIVFTQIDRYTSNAEISKGNALSAFQECGAKYVQYTFD